MKKISLLLFAFLFGLTVSAQTDTVNKKRNNVKSKSAVTQPLERNPDGTVKITKTYHGTTKPNTNAVKNNTTGSPDPVRRPTDTTATPSGTMGPDKSRGGNTTKTTVPNGTSPMPNTGTTVPRT